MEATRWLKPDLDAMILKARGVGRGHTPRCYVGPGAFLRLRCPRSSNARRASVEVSRTGPTVPHLKQRAT